MKNTHCKKRVLRKLGKTQKYGKNIGGNIGGNINGNKIWNHTKELVNRALNNKYQTNDEYKDAENKYKKKMLMPKNITNHEEYKKYKSFIY